MSEDEWNDPDNLDEDDDSLTGTVMLCIAAGASIALLVFTEPIVGAVAIAWLIAGTTMRIAEEVSQ